MFAVYLYYRNDKNFLSKLYIPKLNMELEINKYPLYFEFVDENDKNKLILNNDIVNRIPIENNLIEKTLVIDNISRNNLDILKPILYVHYRKYILNYILEYIDVNYIIFNKLEYDLYKYILKILNQTKYIKDAVKILKITPHKLRSLIKKYKLEKTKRGWIEYDNMYVILHKDDTQNKKAFNKDELLKALNENKTIKNTCNYYNVSYSYLNNYIKKYNIKYAYGRKWKC